MPTLYTFTDADVQSAFETLDQTLFARKRDLTPTGDPEPKILIVAGTQGSGKTYLLENTLLKMESYQHFIPLYLPEFRKLHPQYEEMIGHGTLHAYEHTESFIWQLGGVVLRNALDNRYNIIMETALDDPSFAAFPPLAVSAGYQFDVHLIACQKEFSHWSTLNRAVKSVTNNELERFVPLSGIEASQANAKAILDAFEDACTQVTGSKITVYQRGFQNNKDRSILCHSVCETLQELSPKPDYLGQSFASALPAVELFQIKRTPTENKPCSYPQYSQVVHAGMIEPAVRREMVNACCQTLSMAQKIESKVPRDTFRELCLYVLKYVHP